MAVSGRWKLVATIFAATLALAGCGDDGGSGNGDNNNGGSNAGNNAGTNGDSTGNSTSGTPDGGVTTDLDDNVAGQACNTDSDCKGTGAKCATTIGGIEIFGMSIGGRPAPDGYCTGPCTADNQCGKGGACVGASPLAPGGCQQTCDGDGDCRTGHECNEGQTFDADSGLPPGQMPVVIPDTCLPKPETVDIEDGKVGQACTADTDCGGGVCSTRLGLGTTAPGGYCSGPCTEDTQCGTGGVCSGANPITGAGVCYLGCAANSECTRDGYTCRTPGLFGGDIEVCYPGMDEDAGA